MAASGTGPAKRDRKKATAAEKAAPPVQDVAQPQPTPDLANAVKAVDAGGGTETADVSLAVKPAKVPMLRVAARVDGFRRAGRAWSTQAVDVPASDFTEEQLGRLKDEPSLVVVELETGGEQ